MVNKEKEMEETGAALRRIPNGANLRANKKTVTILKVTSANMEFCETRTLNLHWQLASIASQDKCIDLIRALDEKENQIAQVIWSVGFKFMVLSFLLDRSFRSFMRLLAPLFNQLCEAVVCMGNTKDQVGKKDGPFNANYAIFFANAR